MTLLPVHIIAGSLALIAGGVAMYAAKGGAVHRKSGMLFVYSMVAMTLSAIVIGLLLGHRFNASQGALTCYLVGSAYFAVKYRSGEKRWLIIAGMLLAFGIGTYYIRLGMEALASPGGSLNGIPGQAMFAFGALALLAAGGDLRFLRVAQPSTRQRVGRHLWRMGAALWIATASFFLGQANFIPEPLRLLPLLVLPVLLVFGATIYWLVRVSVRGKPWTASPSRRAVRVERAA